jgi:hypothetical protein
MQFLVDSLIKINGTIDSSCLSLVILIIFIVILNDLAIEYNQIVVGLN